MYNISMIACVGQYFELGKNNDLIWHLPNDLKFFKEQTLGKTVVMGRRTFLSLPKKLPNRKNVVLMLREEEPIDDVIIYHDIPSILNDFKDEEIFIIGGASIYRQFLPYAKKLYLTEVSLSCSDASVYFPEFDKTLYKKTILKENSDNGINYCHVLYERNDL